MYTKTFMKMRILFAQEVDARLFEPENKSRCHKRIYETYIGPILGISYDTYLGYLKRKIQGEPDLKLPKMIELWIAELVRLDSELKPMRVIAPKPRQAKTKPGTHRKPKGNLSEASRRAAPKKEPAKRR